MLKLLGRLGFRSTIYFGLRLNEKVQLVIWARSGLAIGPTPRIGPQQKYSGIAKREGASLGLISYGLRPKGQATGPHKPGSRAQRCRATTLRSPASGEQGGSRAHRVGRGNER